MEFYTDCRTAGKNILLRYVKNGRRYMDRIPYSPTLYLIDRNAKESKHTTVYGEPLKPIHFKSIYEARELLQRHKDTVNVKVYGNDSFHYVFLADRYPEEKAVPFDDSLLVVANIDIEVGSESGFPTADLAEHPITAITILIRDTYYVFGMGEFIPHRPDIEYKRFKTEEIMLEAFLQFWERCRPDIVTGWYIANFDIPYLINRIRRILPPESEMRLSPWGIIREGGVVSKGREMMTFDIFGVATLDYINLYTKFTNTPQESYSLNHISYIELKKKKLSYDEYGTLHKLYKTNHQLFMEYNIRDVELVHLLDQKLKLISLVLNIAYDAKVNYQDVFAQVRMWSAIAFGYLYRRNIHIPPRRVISEEEERDRKEYKGAYVKEPVPGPYEWVLSFDVDSEYPMTMAGWNISPETILDGRVDFNVSAYYEGRMGLNTEMLVREDITMAANGHFFRRDKQGFLPAILVKKFENRLHYKELAKQAGEKRKAVEKEMLRRGMTIPS